MSHNQCGHFVMGRSLEVLSDRLAALVSEYGIGLYWLLKFYRKLNKSSNQQSRGTEHMYIYCMQS